MNISIKVDKPLFNDTWREWVLLNVERDCSRREMMDLLIENGFSESEAITRISDAQQTLSCRPVIVDDEMEQRPVFIPTAQKIDVNGAEIYTVDNFLNDEECARLISLMRPHLERSTVTGAQSISDCRTSKTCALASLQDSFSNEIDARICRILGIDAKHSESIQGQWYDVGEEFKPHTDYFEPGSSDFHKHTDAMGQRSWTFMLYLNTTRKGGATAFPELGIDFKPRAGTAVIWNNLDESGDLNSLTMHHGMPVEEGFKVIITKWFRSKTKKIRYHKEVNEYIEPITRNGFMKCRMPDALFDQIRDFYEIKGSLREDEHLPKFIRAENPSGHGTPSEIIELSTELRRTIHSVLQPLVEAWAGDLLEPTYVYGIRNYKRGSILKIHRDRLETHVASVILNISQTVDEDWLLHMEDHHYKQHKIALAVGDMIFYEGARLAHGRPSALKGDEYANVFVHYKRKE